MSLNIGFEFGTLLYMCFWILGSTSFSFILIQNNIQIIPNIRIDEVFASDSSHDEIF